MYFLAVSNCFCVTIELIQLSHCLFQCQGVSACLSLSLSVNLSCCLSLTLSYGCWLSLTVSPVSRSCWRFHTVFQGCPYFPTVPSKYKEILSLFFMVAGCLRLSFPVLWSFFLSLMVMAVSNCLSGSVEFLQDSISHCCLLSLTVSSSTIELLHVSHCLLLLSAVSHSVSQFHGVSEYLSLSPMIACCLSLPLQVLWSCWRSLTLPYGCLLSLTVSSSSKEFMHVSHYLLCLLSVSHYPFLCHGVAGGLLLSLFFSGCL